MSFRLPNFLNWTPLNKLRQKMGAPLTENFVLDPIKPLMSEDIEIDDLREIQVHEDGTLLQNGKRILLHIRDITKDSSMPKYHLADCQTLEKMRRISRIKRYVNAQKDTGEFNINIITDSDVQPQMVRLDICQHCLEKLVWEGFGEQSMSSSERARRVASFSLSDFFKKYPRDLIESKPFHTSDTAPLNIYPKNWAEISRSTKLKRGQKCEACGKLLKQEYSKFLHVHHRNGLKNDNRDSNLAVLCVACHAEQPEHGHLKALPDYKKYKSLNSR